MSWKVALESFLRNEMRYAFLPSPETGDYPKIHEVEFVEFMGAARVVMYEEMKALWLKAYCAGSTDALEDAAPGCYHIDPDLNRQGAEKRWQEQDK